MSRDVRAICRPEVAAGLRLAGLVVLEASRRDEVPALLEGASDAGLVLVQQELYDRDDPVAQAAGLPVVVPFPGPAWREGAVDDHVLEILRRAIGYRVRLR